MVALAALAGFGVAQCNTEQTRLGVMQLLVRARCDAGSELMVSSLAEECRAMLRHILHRGAPKHLDLVAEAAGDVLEAATGITVLSSQAVEAKRILRRGCEQLKRTGLDVAPLDTVGELAQLSVRLPALANCSRAQLEVLAAPITRLLLALFAS
jgi:hypothetical protein